MEVELTELIKKRRTKPGGFILGAYASEAHAQSDTLRVVETNPCLSCHKPDSTHARWTTSGQITVGPQLSVGANMGVDAADSSKVSGNVSASAIVGFSMSVTENSKAGTPAMPVIAVDTTSTQVDTTN